MVLLTRRCFSVLLILVSATCASRPDRYMASSSMESTTVPPILSSSSASGTMVYNSVHSSKTTSLNHSSLASSTSHLRIPTGKAAHMLTASDSVVKESQGDVLITGNAENVELIVGSGLTIGVNLDNCFDKIIICYDAKYTPSMRAQSVCHSAAQCALTFEQDPGYPGNILFNGDYTAYRSQLPGYSEALMNTGEIFYFNRGLRSSDGCAPKIENGQVIMHYVLTSSTCPVTIRNAKIKPPASAHPTDANGNVIKATNTEEAEDTLFAPWKIAIVAVVGVLAIILVGVFIFFCVVKDPKKKEDVKVSPKKSSLNLANEDSGPVVTVKPEPVKAKPRSSAKPKASKNHADKKAKSKRVKKEVPAVKQAEDVKTVETFLPAQMVDPALEPVKENVLEPVVEAKPVAPSLNDASKEEPLVVDVTQRDETKTASKKKKKAKKPKTPPARVDNTSFEAPPQPSAEPELSVDVTQDNIEPAPKAERGRAAVPVLCNVVKEKPEEWYSSLRRGDIPHPRSNLSRSGRSEKKSKPRQQ